MENSNQQTRISKSIYFKLHVIEHFENSQNVSETAREFNIQRKSVRYYLSQANKLREAPKKRKNSRLHNRKPKFPECEAKLIVWFREQRAKKVCVSGKELCAMMLEFVVLENGVADKDGFMASNGWLVNFTERYRLSRRRITTSGREFPTNSQQIVSKHISTVNEYIDDNNYTLAETANMDESSFEMDAPGSYTFEQTGSQRIEAFHTGQDRTKICCCFTATALGVKLPVLMIVKRSNDLENFVPPSDCIPIYLTKGVKISNYIWLKLKSLFLTGTITWSVCFN